MGEANFDALEAHIREMGTSHEDNLLQGDARKVVLLCRACGVLPSEGEGWVSLCTRAFTHAMDTGHRVIADHWQAAVYGRP